MINFEFSNTTEIIFGRDTQKQVGEKIRKYSDCTKVLLVYGSDRIKRGIRFRYKPDGGTPYADHWRSRESVSWNWEA